MEAQLTSKVIMSWITGLFILFLCYPTPMLAKTVASAQYKGESSVWPLGCKELRSKRFISDGSCTSVKPLTEVVCAGTCLPVNLLPWYSDYVGVKSRKSPVEWQCIDDVIKHKRVQLLCKDGQERTYVIRVVHSCKCKKVRREAHNKTNNQHHQNHHHAAAAIRA